MSLIIITISFSISICLICFTHVLQANSISNLLSFYE